MKIKKKNSQSKSIKLIKLINTKNSDEPQKTFNSTKQKTFTTIESHMESLQSKNVSLRSSLKNRLNDSKKSYIERMESNNISPFSDEDQKSLSPKLKNLHPSKSSKQLKTNLQENCKKKTNKIKSANNQQVKKNAKCNVISNKKQNRQKCKNRAQIEQNARFQNELLTMMNHKKITQVSEEDMEGSIRRKKKTVFNNIQILTLDANKNRSKHQIVRSMKLKFTKKYELQHPQLDQNQLKLMVTVAIIQLLWRQKKVKQFISHYVTPKSSPETSFRQSFNKYEKSHSLSFNSVNKLILKSIKTQNQDKSQFCQTNSYELFLKKKQKSQQIQNSPTKSKQIEKAEQKKGSNKILCVENESEKIIKDNLDRNTLLKFVEHYRNVKLNKKTTTKTNVFSLKESLSEKCLMQRYYDKIFLEKPEIGQPNNYEMFSNFQNKKSIELFKTYQQDEVIISQKIIAEQNLSKETDQMELGTISNNKNERLDEQIWIRSETNQGNDNNSSEEFDTTLNNQTIKADSQINATREDSQQAKIQPKKLSLQDLQTFPSIKQIHQAAQNIIAFLMEQFATEFTSFTQKKCLTKKKKAKLPGLQSNTQSIETYLKGITHYILQNNRPQIYRSLLIYTPQIYLKTHRSYDDSIYQIFECQEEEQNYFWDIVTVQSFVQYQEYYQKNHLKLTEQQQKYKNFVLLSSKIINRCISAAFSEQLEKQILTLRSLCWEKNSNKINRLEHLQIQKKDENANKKKNIKQITLDSIVRRVEEKILLDSKKTKLGSIHSRDKDEQQRKLNKHIREQYNEEGEQWSDKDQRYEINFELSEHILNSLLKQLVEEFSQYNI